MFPYFPHSSSPVCPQHCSCNTVTATYHCNQHTNFQNPQPHTSLPHTRTHHQKSQAHFPFSLSKGIAPFHTVLYMYCCMLMQCLRQGPVFLPSSINSYCQTTANSNMWTTTLQSWHCEFYQTDFLFCSYLVSFADCLNFNNMTVFSVVLPDVLASVIHSFTNSVTLYLSTLQKTRSPSHNQHSKSCNQVPPPSTFSILSLP